MPDFTLFFAFLNLFPSSPTADFLKSASILPFFCSVAIHINRVVQILATQPGSFEFDGRARVMI